MQGSGAVSQHRERFLQADEVAVPPVEPVAAAFIHVRLGAVQLESRGGEQLGECRDFAMKCGLS